MRHALLQLCMAVILADSGTMPSLAHTTESQCTATDLCLREESNYTGCFRQMTGDQIDYHNIDWESCLSYSIDDDASAASNEGTRCSVRLYEFTGRRGDSLVLYREIGRLILRKHGKLPYGMPGGAYPDRQGRISSRDFCQ